MQFENGAPALGQRWRREEPAADNGVELAAMEAMILFPTWEAIMKWTNGIFLLLAIQIVSGCGGQSVHGDEFSDKDSPYQRGFAVAAPDACEGAQRALLSQGYRTERPDELTIHAHKDFQPEEEVNVVIDFGVTCKSTATGAVMFASAIETSYKLKKTPGATSLSVPGAGSISMPWSKTADALVKVAGNTISDPTFYRRFFDLVASHLAESQTPARGKSGQQARP